MKIVVSHTTAVSLALSPRAHRQRVIEQWSANPNLPLSLNMRCLLQADIEALAKRLADEISKPTPAELAQAKRHATQDVLKQYGVARSAYREPLLGELLQTGPEDFEPATLAQAHVPDLQALKAMPIFEQLRQPIHAIVPSDSARRNSHALICHVQQGAALSAVPCCNDLWMTSPESTLLQIASMLNPKTDLVALTVLCSEFFACYVADPATPGSMLRRQPLTSPERVTDFLAECGKARGKALLTKAVSLSVSVCASPPEIALALFAKFPRCKGGYALEGFVCNKIMQTPSGGQLIVDLCNEERHVAIEYQGHEAHSSVTQLDADTERDATLRLLGYKPMKASRTTMRDIEHLDKFMIGSVAAALGRTRQAEFAKYEDRRRALRTEMFSALGHKYLNALPSADAAASS